MTLETRAHSPQAVAQRWATVLLAATLASGAWLRATMAWPSLAVGANLSYGVHAHSHVAFFGWIVLAVASLAARRVSWTDASIRQWRIVVHALGVLSLAALVGFAGMGYAAPTIVLSALHVALWIPLARMAWSPVLASVEEREWWRWSWTALLAAGAATLVPAIFAARGIREGWWRELGIKLFLALFINGFAGLAAMGALVAHSTRREPEWQGARWARRLIVTGLLPLAILYVATPPPAAWLQWVGRVAVGLVGAGTMTVAILAWRQPHALWTRAAISALALVAVLEGIAAAGVGASLIHVRAVTVAFTHLVLLLTVSPLLAMALLSWRAPPWRALFATLGAATMCTALAALGWPWLGAQADTLGLSALTLLVIAALGGIVAAIAWAAMLRPLFGASSIPTPP